MGANVVLGNPPLPSDHLICQYVATYFALKDLFLLVEHLFYGQLKKKITLCPEPSFS